MYHTKFLEKEYDHKTDVHFLPPMVYPSDEETRDWEEVWEEERKEEVAYHHVLHKFPLKTDVDISELSKKMRKNTEKRISAAKDIVDRFIERKTKKKVLVQCRNMYEANKIMEYASERGCATSTIKKGTQKVTRELIPGETWKRSRAERPIPFVVLN